MQWHFEEAPRATSQQRLALISFRPPQIAELPVWHLWRCLRGQGRSRNKNQESRMKKRQRLVLLLHSSGSDTVPSPYGFSVNVYTCTLMTINYWLSPLRSSHSVKVINVLGVVSQSHVRPWKGFRTLCVNHCRPIHQIVNIFSMYSRGSIIGRWRVYSQTGQLSRSVNYVA